MKTLGKILAVLLTVGIFYCVSALFMSTPVGSDSGNILALCMVAGVIGLVVLVRKLK